MRDVANVSPLPTTKWPPMNNSRFGRLALGRAMRIGKNGASATTSQSRALRRPYVAVRVGFALSHTAPGRALPHRGCVSRRRAASRDACAECLLLEEQRKTIYSQRVFRFLTP